MTRVRNLVQETATRDMQASVAAKGKTDGLVTQVEAINQSLADGIREVSSATQAISQSVGQAVRCLQFEDIATQALAAADKHTNRLQAIFDEAGGHPSGENWRAPAHNPVAQVSMNSGAVELF